jgi:hypothetical protein
METMMKFRLRIFESLWNGKRCTTGKQVKQITFKADGWNKAEAKAFELYKSFEANHNECCSYSLTAVK